MSLTAIPRNPTELPTPDFDRRHCTPSKEAALRFSMTPYPVVIEVASAFLTVMNARSSPCEACLNSIFLPSSTPYRSGAKGITLVLVAEANHRTHTGTHRRITCHPLK